MRPIPLIVSGLLFSRYGSRLVGLLGVLANSDVQRQEELQKGMLQIAEDSAKGLLRRIEAAKDT